jgi:hypothetical protein
MPSDPGTTEPKVTRSRPKHEWGEDVMREMTDYVRGIYGRHPTTKEAHQMYYAWQEEVERIYGE